jgi:hypothetical protein
MLFKTWLEEREKDRDYYRDIILSKLDLDKSKGLSQSLDVMEPEKIINKLNELGEYKALSDDIKNSIEGKIKSGSGTVGDLINIISKNL